MIISLDENNESKGHFMDIKDLNDEADVRVILIRLNRLNKYACKRTA